MRRLLIILFIGAFFAGCVTTGEKASQGSDGYGSKVKWYTLAEGREKALREKKPCVVDFFVSEGCPRCQNMDRFVYSNQEIAEKMNAEFVPIKINLGRELTQEERMLGEKWEFKNDCLLLFMDHRGNVLEDRSGKKICIADYVDPRWFIEYLDIAKEKMKSL